MVGQKMSWFSDDGIEWRAFKKKDWGERISMTQIFFNGRLWVTGGMDYATNTFLNEQWFSVDGREWKRITGPPAWSPRKGHTLAVFRKKLWLFGGVVSVDEHKVPKDLVNDVWSSGDGITWACMTENAPWSARYGAGVVVFKDQLWVVGGQGHSDIWRSSNGKNWEMIRKHSPWGDRYDNGLVVFNDLLWVYGGREADPQKAFKDVWYSADGMNWHMQTKSAPWTARSGVNTVVFNDKLWLYGGKHTGHEDSFSGDIWTLNMVPAPASSLIRP
jgi:hypothetical protein